MGLPGGPREPEAKEGLSLQSPPAAEDAKVVQRRQSELLCGEFPQLPW